MPQPRSAFTFAAGNSRKLLSLPLYAIGRLASVVTRRRPDLWVFGSGSGIGEGALALFEVARDNGHKLVWLTANEAESSAAAARNIPSAPKASWRGFRLTLRAGLIAVTHGFGDVNRFATHGAFVVQLWHGIPLKKIQLDSRVTFTSPIPGMRGLLRRAYRRSAGSIDLMPAASEVSAQRLRTAFGLPADRVVVTGDPRDDVVVTTTRAQARQKLGVGVEEAILYAPTWRDGEIDPAVPSDSEWDEIEAWLLRRDAVLFLRPHPHGVGDYAAGVARCTRVRMLDSRAQPDITPLLPAFDTLVTDYSSIAFDFALTGGAIAFLAPDVEHYSATRGLYENYENFSGGTAVGSWTELLALLDTSDDALRKHSQRLAQRYHAFRDGRNADRVYAEIIDRFHGPAGGTRMSSSLAAGTGMAIDEVSIEAVGLTVGGADLGVAVTTATLAGSRLQLSAPVVVEGGRWSATIPLMASRWGGEVLPAPSGKYPLLLSTGDGRVITAEVAAPRVEMLLPGLARVTVDEKGVTLAPPLQDDEIGPANQQRLEAQYRSRTATPEDAVFFESFYGQNSSCNPRALDAAIARLNPMTTRYWSVVDASVAIPEGAVAVIEGSEEWWRVRAAARLLVVNDWLRKRYRRRPHQTVLQTWHGTALKKIAIDRPRQGLRSKIAAILESRRWDVMLSQNPHSTRVFRSAYRYRGPIWEEGYPRNDVLVAGEGSAIRARLGIPEGTAVVLYTPTWRDDRLEHIDHLDVAAFTDALGPEYVTLIRGHSRTLRPGRDVQASNVIDVTGYPDVADLFLVADALVTDYSSVMFDFTVTGKPIFFFTPDLDHYREQLRGFYFDLTEAAPGPVVERSSDLIAAVRSADAAAADYAERYAAWRARFNPRDDGGAAERVVARLVEIGALR